MVWMYVTGWTQLILLKCFPLLVQNLRRLACVTGLINRMCRSEVYKLWGEFQLCLLSFLNFSSIKKAFIFKEKLLVLTFWYLSFYFFCPFLSIFSSSYEFSHLIQQLCPKAFKFVLRKYFFLSNWLIHLFLKLGNST